MSNSRTSSARLRRSALAGTIAVILLAGGAATWAGWDVMKPAGTGTVQAGNLDLAVSPASGTGWTLYHAADTSASPVYGTGVPVTDLSAVKIVPGDKIVFNATATATLVGANLKANLTLDTTSLPPSAPLVVDTPALTDGGAAITNPLTEAQSGHAINTQVAVTLPWSTSGRTGTAVTVDLSGLNLALVQQL